ncbi:MAG: Txe/YoeB family addiction module toxin [Thermosynechococcaceae cyanobacterium]
MSKKNKLSVSKDATEIAFSRKFREDLQYWIQVDRKVALRLLDLVNAIERDPFIGIGKPEPLKFAGSDLWSRRLTQEHRIVYLIEHERIYFLAARFHY